MSEPGQNQDSGDLLIRSTRAQLRLHRHGPGPLRDRRGDPGPLRDQRGDPGPLRDQRGDPGLVCTDPPAAPRPSTEPPPLGGEELRTLRLAAGGRGVGLEALRQRSQSAPHRRQVKVTLLHSQDAPRQSAVTGGAQDYSSQDAPGQSAVTKGAQDYSSQDAPGQAHSCPMERLLQHRGSALMEETLQRLETFHNQQLSLQNQLLDSALRLAVRPQAPPPVVVAPPCCCNLVTHSLSPVHHTEVPRPEQREEPEEPPGPRAAQSRPRTFQNQPRPSRASEHTRGRVQAPHPPQTRPRTTSKHHLNAEEHPTAEQQPINAEAQDQSCGEGPERVQNISVDQERAREQPHLHHQEDYVQYLQNRIKTNQREEKHHAQGKENMVSSKLVMGSCRGFHGLGSGPGGLEALDAPGGPCSGLDEARLVLRRVQRQRKVLEENLESQLRARSEELFHCRLNALTQNRDCSNEIRIKKTVDSFIRDFQAEMERTAAGTKDSANKTAVSRRNPAPSGRPLGTNVKPSRTQTSHSRTQTRPSRTQTRPSRTQTRPSRTQTSPSRTQTRRAIDPVLDSPPEPPRDPAERLRHIYGNAPHDGQRRSLKRSPYLRLTSPVSPDRSRPRPPLVQRLRGVKLKSCKTQTPGPGLSPSPAPGFPSVAVPLGRPRKGPSHRARQEATSPPRAPPTPPPQEQEVTSAPTSAPEEEPGAEQQSADPPLVHVLQSSPQQEQEEEEFPGTNFLSVADVQQSEAESEEVRSEAGSEGLLQLEGGPGPDPVQYQGPQFPPQTPALPPPSAQERSLKLGLSLQRDALEQRLVQWVEQQVMLRIISDMYRTPLSDPTHLPYTGQSEPHFLSPGQSDPSAALDLGPLGCGDSGPSGLSGPSGPSGRGDPGPSGDSGPSGLLQLQVESALDLDQEQVRGLVLKVLTEIVAQFLGSRESQAPQTEPGPYPDPDPGAEAGAAQQSVTQTQETLIPTPEATPPQTPPLSPVATPRVTPPPSDWPVVREDPPPEPVATPPPTPPVTCPDAEPLLVQTQEQEEEPDAPPPPEPSPAPAAVAPPPGPPSPPDASSSPSCTSSASSGTSVTAPRHISEGELLLSHRHLQALHEENSSFSSSLHELQEMELDPPSEGQVHSSILLTFLTKLQQREPRPPPEGAWGRGLEEDEEASAGEIRDATAARASDRSRSPGQTSPGGEALEQTNQSAPSEGLLASDLLHTAQALAPVSAPKESLDLGLTRVPEPPRTLQTQASPSDPDQDQDQEQRVSGVGGAEGGADGSPALVKMAVFVPSMETAETSGDSFSDAF